MGAFASSFVPTEEETVSVKPANPGWILNHVKACGASIITVQRCWQRFLQLGGNKNGVLPPKAKIYSTTDKFLKQILALIPKNENSTISFQVFLNACVWFETASPEEKSKLLFYLLNKGQPVDTALFTRVLSHLYEGIPQEELGELASVTVKEIGDGNEGAFNEDDFVKWVLSKPDEEMKTLFAFSLLPS